MLRGREKNCQEPNLPPSLVHLQVQVGLYLPWWRVIGKWQILRDMVGCRLLQIVADCCRLLQIVADCEVLHVYSNFSFGGGVFRVSQL
ncbi:unnamed protein product [Ectocarpus sp. 12 AP-2014]